MNRYVAYGVESKKVITTGTEAEIHQYLNRKYPCYRLRFRKTEKMRREIMMDPIYPETLRIEKAEEYYDDLD